MSISAHFTEYIEGAHHLVILWLMKPGDWIPSVSSWLGLHKKVAAQRVMQRILGGFAWRRGSGFSADVG